ncbi:anoctamin-4-like isoform X2 [Xenia sp. Carnegie-2017]|uniref:anoctamin-4-like isoform X2 n=1 Tax=Xenia sp. Carnegie-2017 TaxID=2897299 RepID=UPI001F040850|nr:anoctamin-4-like isoform X2 [Xenia sp. Carnegie-2017]
MVYRMLQMTSFGPEEQDYGIMSLCDDGTYTATYPLHDGPSKQKDGVANDRQKLRSDWSSFRRMFTYQPINIVRRYFGGMIGFYYAWLGVYISMLVPAAIVGLLCFLYGIVSLQSFEPANEICDEKNEQLFYMCPQCDRHCSFWSLRTSCYFAQVSHLFDNEATVFFSVFMSVWATLFLEYWKRVQVRLGYEWGVHNFIDEYELPRPQFIFSVRTKRKNPVTDKLEPYVPSMTRIKRIMGSLGVIFFMGCVVVASIAGIVAYRASVLAVLYANSNNDVRQNAKLMTSFSAAIINLVFIKILSFVYVKLAVMLTDWENPRTKSEYQNLLTFKMYVFEFVNTYSSLFYIAFFKSSLLIGNPTKYHRMNDRRVEGCDPSGCLTDLCIQLAVIMIGKQIFSFVLEFFYPSAVRSWNKWWYKPSDENRKLPQWESDYLLNPEPDFRMFYEYLEMVIQFGFVTMFVASFPLAPLFALINNIFELRADATNFAVNFRRPVAGEVKNIGIWFRILEILTKISVLVNSFVIAFTTDFVPRLVYIFGYSEDGTLKDSKIIWKLRHRTDTVNNSFTSLLLV